MTDSLVFLDLKDNKVCMIDVDGSNYRVLFQKDCTCPDGVALDLNQYKKTGKREDIIVWWSNMGQFKPNPQDKDGGDWSEPNGFLVHAPLFGGDEKSVRATFSDTAPRITTMKQITLSKDGKKVFFCDREGHKVWSYSSETDEFVILLHTDDLPLSSPTGSVLPGSDEDKLRWCVGIEIDEKNNYIFFTIKGPSSAGKGKIFAAPFNFDQKASTISPQDVITIKENLPEPIDLLLDESNGLLYWTDRGDASVGGNTLNRAPLHYSASTGKPIVGEMEVLLSGFGDAVGLTWAAKSCNSKVPESHRFMYVTDIAGSLWKCDLETKTKEAIYHGCGLTGIEYLPSHDKL